MAYGSRRSPGRRVKVFPPARGSERAASISALRFGERADQTGRTLGVAVQRLDQLVARQPGLQLRRLKVGRDQREDVVMRRARRRTRAGVMRQLHQALAADIFVGLPGDLTLGETGDRNRNAVGHPVADAAGRTTLRIEHQDRKALGARRRVRPGERRRYVLADAIWIGLVAAGVLQRQPLAILEVR